MPEGSRVFAPLYRVFHLNEEDRIARAEVIEAASDADAVAHGQKLALDHAVELWDRGRFVARIEASERSPSTR